MGNLLAERLETKKVRGMYLILLRVLSIFLLWSGMLLAWCPGITTFNAYLSY